MKVAISFGNAADIVANAQGRPRFSFGNAVGKKRNASRRCEAAINAMYITIRHFVALYGVSKRSAF